MIINSLMLTIIFAFLVFASSDVYAFSFNKNLTSREQFSDAQLLADGTKYRYLKIISKADSQDANYSISYVTCNHISKINTITPMGTSPVEYKGTRTYVTYILPRIGMSCPTDADYCFGAGKNDNSTTLIQGNECDGKWCSIYGVRVKNNKYFKSYNITVEYNFGL